MIEFKMPSLGADMEAGTLREWRKKVGDVVKRGDIIADVDTQKGLIEIEVFDDGIIQELLLKENEKVPVGTVMAIISPAGEKREETRVEIKKEPAEIKISPLARKIALENQIDISSIKGSGEGGAIVKADVEKLIHSKSFVQETGTEKNFRKAIAAAMSKSKKDIPHYYLQTKADLSKTLDWLRKENEKQPVEKRILPITLFIKAVASAVKDMPDFNAFWDDGVVRKPEVNIAVILSLREGGVVAPAIKNVNDKSLPDIMSSLSDLIIRSRENKLRSSDLSESTITITSLGDNSVETVYGIIYPPQVALVGFGCIKEEPWAQSGMLDVRQVVNITLSADHRASDGNSGSKFLMRIREILENPGLL